MRFWRWHRPDRDPLVCREFVELVTDYLEGTLPDSERVRMEAQLAECDGCTAISKTCAAWSAPCT